MHGEIILMHSKHLNEFNELAAQINHSNQIPELQQLVLRLLNGSSNHLKTEDEHNQTKSM
jgi:hypothetical protein